MEAKHGTVDQAVWRDYRESKLYQAGDEDDSRIKRALVFGYVIGIGTIIDAVRARHTQALPHVLKLIMSQIRDYLQAEGLGGAFNKDPPHV